MKKLFNLTTCLFIIFLLQTSIVADDVISIHDTSGLSSEEVQNIAQDSDNAESRKTIKKQTTSNNGAWEQLAPTPERYDWIELKSSEWLKGEFKVMYEEELEFDSKELDLLTLDFEDIKQIRTHRIVTVRLLVEDENSSGLFGLHHTAIEVTGILRLNDQKVIIIRGDGNLEFQRKQIVSIVYGGNREAEYWSGKFNIGVDVQTGNTEKLDYSTIAKVQRRTSKTQLKLDYLGNISYINETETINNHRFNESFNVFTTRHFYYTPLFSEFFSDKYQNIHSQYTFGIGIGYVIVDSRRVNWSVTGGPAVVLTKYSTVEEGRDDSIKTGALELSTSYDVEINKKIDFIFSYKLTLTEKNAGSYKHHIVTALENELTSWLDIDLTVIWDYTLYPEPNEDATIPEKSDLQFLVSFGVDF
ncbi:MAG: DUF481 domain-containing protein [Campylobacterota bacterium]|nr:DUF481 domain-containing protein [Campylobacterota bacterium]